MRRSHFFLPTLRETPADADVISQKLMMRAGMIRRLSSGLYTWLPLGLRVLRNVERIVREEQNRIGAQEILMPAVQPAELWEETNRWEAFGPQLLKIIDRHERRFCFGPTHEEVVTDLLRNELQSYKQLPVTVYQIQTKFRDEIRPRFGVMRAREFLMKDAYSFNFSLDSLKESYALMREAYCKTFTRLGLNFRVVKADSGAIGGDASEEFHVLAESGEDLLLFSDKSDYAANIEVAKANAGDPSPDGQGTLSMARGIEVGHIFQLGDKYSAAMGLNVLDASGKKAPVYMGCYGIGVSRIVAAAIEQHHDDKGIIWPAAMAPFQVTLIGIAAHRNETVYKTCEDLYAKLHTLNIEVLWDDRDERPGLLFADAELLGIPHRIVISEKTLSSHQVEYTSRETGVSSLLSMEEVINKLVASTKI